MVRDPASGRDLHNDVECPLSLNLTLSVIGITITRDNSPVCSAVSRTPGASDRRFLGVVAGRRYGGRL
ncbi:hypothetical protein J6590_007409 [Homalodisca vitripennis]|nr:hypothetical protein J6590_007409 [Homalodisca vitripennis]